MSAAVLARLKARGRQLAQAAGARLRRRVAQRWQGLGVLNEGSDALRLSGPGVVQRRRGSRSTLPDPQLLWPGDE
ncbi:MAG: hypothetical protein B7Y82_05275 [Sphingomonadales bacterium 32-65-25]|nr:MAG: hypothetical protein B7Z50_00480 [Sphingomonadales bacterium 12-62-5]OYX77963.1 MAG: hypothetical protein B7Y82_05275 [Sphingomonadales bacterium 32-65-25]